jgi:hypothetical protein
MRPASAAPPDCSKPGCVLADDVLALIMTAVAGGYIQERETTTIEIALVGDAILGRQPLPDALTWHCASSLQTNDTGREERKFHCGLHKAIQGTRRLAARLDERRHQYALLDLSQTIPHGGFAYLSRTARPTKDEDRGSAPANSSPHDNALRRQCTIELLRSKSGPPHNPPRRLDCGFGARTTIARASRYNGQHHKT